MSLNYGVDYSTMAGPNKDQLDTTFSNIIDPYDVILEDVYRRLTTTQGTLDPPIGMFWDTNTLDLRDYLMASYPQKQIARLQQDIETIFYEELRYAIEVQITVIGSGITQLQVDVQVFPSTNLNPIQVTFIVGTNQVEFKRVS